MSGPKPGTVKRPDRAEAMKGNQYAIGNKGPPPSKYTPEFIENEAKELLKWSKKKDNLYMKGFALERGYSPQRMVEWSKHNKDFAEAYSQAADWQELKIVNGSIKNKLNPNISKFVLACKHKWKEPAPDMPEYSKSSMQEYSKNQREKYASSRHES